MSHAIQLTLKSRNAKVGPIPVSTSSAETCPDACPLKRNGCYAEGGPLGILWAALSRATAGERYKSGKGNVQSLTWSGFVDAIKALPTGALWRHNQAGDLPGFNDSIDAKALKALADANKGKRGYTYTHKPLSGPHGKANAKAIAAANADGFTINLSADNMGEADELAASKVGPVVVVLPDTIEGNAKLSTPEGRRVVVCPATYRDDITCSTCKLCAIATRETIVGFPAHGASKRKASAIALS
jgi:hypothetical protein